jgi:5-formyltetrahydrofolate cyclo-ligase
LTSQQSQLRQKGRNARASLDEQTRNFASTIITRKVLASDWFQRADYVCCYLPAPVEVNTWDIISRAWRMKKRVFAPVCENNFRMQFREVLPDTDLYLNRHGVFEPSGGETVVSRMLDIVIAPVVAFDRDNNRIGMGGGYFDRAFSFLRHRSAWLHPKLVGVAFACQQVEKIAPNPWDIRLFSVITEKDGNTGRQ